MRNSGINFKLLLLVLDRRDCLLNMNTPFSVGVAMKMETMPRDEGENWGFRRGER